MLKRSFYWGEDQKKTVEVFDVIVLEHTTRLRGKMENVVINQTLFQYLSQRRQKILTEVTRGSVHLCRYHIFYHNLHILPYGETIKKDDRLPLEELRRGFEVPVEEYGPEKIWWRPFSKGYHLSAGVTRKGRRIIGKGTTIVSIADHHDTMKDVSNSLGIYEFILLQVFIRETNTLSEFSVHVNGLEKAQSNSLSNESSTRMKNFLTPSYNGHVRNPPNGFTVLR
mmetsp:Transcript_18286/g.38196  ORF Transcript_18286/g.38196 Transcript_18286/m.38196 type:complete len:225 (-) Transcript_18286:737-1411(-)